MCRFTSADAELHKDVEGVLEGYCHTLLALLQNPAWHSEDAAAREQAAAALLTPLLELLDGVCCLYAQTAKPSAWLNVVLKTLKAATPEARALAAGSAQVFLFWRLLCPRLTLQALCCRPSRIHARLLITWHNASVQVISSQAMQKAAPMWQTLKPAALKPLFAIAEVEDTGRATKRPKR